MLEDRAAWLSLEPYEREYHVSQYTAPCEYATSFMSFLERRAGFRPDSSFSVLDIGTGAGGHLWWMAKRFPRCTFVGVDVNPELIAVAEERHIGCPATSFRALDLADSADLGDFDWIVSLQVLSWIDAELAWQSICSQMAHARRGIAMTALFTRYEADYLVSVVDRKAGKRKPLNVFGIDGVGTLAASRGWHVESVEDFEMEVDLGDEGRPRGIRTVTTADGHRLALAGDLYMPWRHLLLLPGCESTPQR